MDYDSKQFDQFSIVNGSRQNRLWPGKIFKFDEHIVYNCIILQKEQKLRAQRLWNMLNSIRPIYSTIQKFETYN